MPALKKVIYFLRKNYAPDAKGKRVLLQIKLRENKNQDFQRKIRKNYNQNGDYLIFFLFTSSF